MRGLGSKEDSWDIRDKEFNEYVIKVATKDGLPIPTKDELEEK